MNVHDTPCPPLEHGEVNECLVDNLGVVHRPPGVDETERTKGQTGDEPRGRRTTQGKDLREEGRSGDKEGEHEGTNG